MSFVVKFGLLVQRIRVSSSANQGQVRVFLKPSQEKGSKIEAEHNTTQRFSSTLHPISQYDRNSNLE